MTPRVSVVMPVYNGAAFIRDAIDDILGQTFPDLELIVADDGSTDETTNVVRAVGDPRVRLLEAKDNEGVVSALRRGRDAATAPLIARMDADDRTDASRIARLVAAFDANPRLGLMGTAGLIEDEETSTTRIHVNEPNNDLLQRLLIIENRYFHGSTMFRADAYDAVGGYRKDFEPAEDYDLWLRIAEQFEVGNVPDVLYTWRRHAQSSSVRMRRRQNAQAAAAVRAALARRAGRADAGGARLDATAAIDRLGEARFLAHQRWWADGARRAYGQPRRVRAGASLGISLEARRTARRSPLARQT